MLHYCCLSAWGSTILHIFLGQLQRTTRLHNAVLGHVLRTPSALFHANSAGCLLNRFSKDQGVTDDQLPLTFFDTLQSSFMVAVDLSAVSYITYLLNLGTVR